MLHSLPEMINLSLSPTKVSKGLSYVRLNRYRAEKSWTTRVHLAFYMWNPRLDPHAPIAPCSAYGRTIWLGTPATEGGEGEVGGDSDSEDQSWLPCKVNGENCFRSRANGTDLRTPCSVEPPSAGPFTCLGMGGGTNHKFHRISRTFGCEHTLK